MNSEKLARDLVETGWSVDPGFISPAMSKSLLSEALSARATGQFKAAGTGKNATASDERKDRILWFEQNSLAPAMEKLWEQLDTFRDEMNRTLFLGLRDFEAHFSCYEEGAYYRKHIDRFRSDDRRTVSTVIYLNEDWKTGDGGQLKLFTGNGEKLIAPSAGTMVSFMSDRIEHEVLPTKKPRWSIAVWFKRGGPGGLS